MSRLRSRSFALKIDDTEPAREDTSLLTILNSEPCGSHHHGEELLPVIDAPKSAGGCGRGETPILTQWN